MSAPTAQYSNTALGGPPQAYERQQPSLWMITFGDLLTLILCFFIAIISLSRIEKNSSGKTLAATARQTTASQQVGTTIAEEVHERNPRQGSGQAAEVLALSDEQVQEPGLLTLATWSRGLTTEREDLIEITTCVGRDEFEGLGREVAAILAASLSSPVKVRFAEIGVSCAELRERGGSIVREDTTMVVRLLKQSHGRR